MSEVLPYLAMAPLVIGYLVACYFNQHGRFTIIIIASISALMSFIWGLEQVVK